jgi:hypothetical protein
MKSKPKSFPSSSTFSDFLSQLKEEEEASLTSKNSNSENLSSSDNQPIVNALEKVDEPSSDSTQIASAELGKNNETEEDSQAIKVDTGVEDILETHIQTTGSSTNQKSKAVFASQSDKPVNTDQHESIKSMKPTLAELTKLLANLPTAQITRRGYNREELQVRLSADLSLALRNLSAYLLLTNSGSNFHIDDLVNHLVRQFVLINLESIQQMGNRLAKAETSRQLQINESLRSIERK